MRRMENGKNEKENSEESGENEDRWRTGGEIGEQREWRKGNWMKSRRMVMQSRVRMENRENGERGTG